MRYQTEKENINWEQVAEVLRRSGLSDHSAQEQETAFRNSYATVFVYDDEKIVGVARAISDGVFQAAIYNVALDLEYQGEGVGREMIHRLIAQLPGQNVILYTHPQTVLLYEKLGFRRAKTAMEYFQMDPDKLEWMEQEGFFMKENYRFPEEIGRKDMQGPAWKDQKRR
ncbi:MAG: GNAT family N-acetyltransferase [Lachnospiraceae bacterium]|nr:GNAT family N-acetyltransferase [Lachnospiraceae bacterium]